MCEEKIQALKKVFEEWDTSDDGQISGGELKAVLEKIYSLPVDDKPDYLAEKTVENAEADAGEFLIALDQDKDYKVSWDEFKGLLAKGSS